ncbi:Rha family transcriptional regulator [Lysinibacillus sphaericus]|uniref:Rha family transcriptional regulator n=1 Tax=Lysinibacillus sphaericus TaxID=1421 RepID=UPI001A9FDECC|nr:Rha family transcriptional regulator [Lysinibacillus sphaericus]QTB28846.1 Rha family transcriptional regulator [Lysinibacillus sphaericus]
MTLQQLLEGHQGIVFVNDNKAFTDSRIIAKVFQKGHDKVLRDIRNLKCSEAFRLANIGEADYVNGQGRKMPMYVLTFDGFVILAMGYTGEKAMQFKELYIAAFNHTHQLLANRQNTLLFNEQQTISSAVKGRLSILYPNLSSQAKRKYFSTLYKTLKEQFQVLSYKDIPRNSFAEALAFINHWDSPKLGSPQKNKEIQKVEYSK